MLCQLIKYSNRMQGWYLNWTIYLMSIMCFKQHKSVSSQWAQSMPGEEKSQKWLQYASKSFKVGGLFGGWGGGGAGPNPILVSLKKSLKKLLTWLSLPSTLQILIMLMSAYIEVKYINPNSLIHTCTKNYLRSKGSENILPRITRAVFHLRLIRMLEANPCTFDLSRVVQIQTFLPGIPFICENGCYDHQSRWCRSGPTWSWRKT